LLNTSSKPLLRAGVGKLPETYGTKTQKINAFLRVINKFVRYAGEPVVTEQKYIREFTLTYYYHQLEIA
jgi:hypothetical protein